MFKSKDFSLMEVIHIKNNRIGFIKDMLLDFNKKKVLGFQISSYDIINKNLNVMIEDIITFENSMVIKNTSKSKHLSFNSIKGIDITDNKGNVIGMLEEILFEEESFNIYGIVLSSGLLNNYLKGKQIILMEEVILGENSILCYEKRNLYFSNRPHKIKLKIGGEVY